MSVSVAELDEIINESRDAREVKRALCVKMALGVLPVGQVCEWPNVSAPFVSKWRGIYEAQGAAALAMAYAGSQG
jgi:putative transposase